MLLIADLRIDRVGVIAPFSMVKGFVMHLNLVIFSEPVKFALAATCDISSAIILFNFPLVTRSSKFSEGYIDYT